MLDELKRGSWGIGCPSDYADEGSRGSTICPFKQPHNLVRLLNLEDFWDQYSFIHYDIHTP